MDYPRGESHIAATHPNVVDANDDIVRIDQLWHGSIFNLRVMRTIKDYRWILHGVVSEKEIYPGYIYQSKMETSQLFAARDLDESDEKSIL